jgi:septum formation protein
VVRLYLASSSPRGRELLARVGLKFTAVPVEVNEAVAEELPPRRLVETLASRKALVAQVEEGLVVGANTVVVCDDRIFGKPRDEAEAAVMLSWLQGRSHRAATGVAVRRMSDGFLAVGHEATTVDSGP